MSTITIIADGGCEPNPGMMYGSFAIDGEVSRADTFGYGTNNLAEYRSVHSALKALYCDTIVLMETDVEVLMDSALVVNQSQGRWHVKDHELRPWANQIKAWKMLFRSVTFKQVPREQIVAVLGH